MNKEWIKTNQSKHFAEYEVTKNNFYCPKCDANLLEKFAIIQILHSSVIPNRICAAHMWRQSRTHGKNTNIVRRYLLIRNVGKRKPNVFLDIYLTLDLNCHNGLIIITHTHKHTHTRTTITIYCRIVCIFALFSATAANYNETKKLYWNRRLLFYIERFITQQHHGGKITFTTKYSNWFWIEQKWSKSYKYMCNLKSNFLSLFITVDHFGRFNWQIYFRIFGKKLSNTMGITIQTMVFMIFSTQNKCWKLIKYWPINNNEKVQILSEWMNHRQCGHGLGCVCWMVTEFCAIW